MYSWLEKDFASVKNQLKLQFGYNPSKNQEGILKRLHKNAFAMCNLIYELSKHEQDKAGFLQELHSDCVQILVLAPLGLRRSSFLSMRAIIEHTLMYLYFKDHPVELELVELEDKENHPDSEQLKYLAFKELLKYIKMHPKLRSLAGMEEILDNLRAEYYRKSKIVHGSTKNYFQSLRTVAEITSKDPDFESVTDDFHKLIGDIMTLVIIFHKETFYKIHPDHRNFILACISDANKKVIHAAN